MRVTAKDIANRLHISAATVSMVLNNKPGISEETRNLVLETAVEMGYAFKHLPSDNFPKGTVCALTVRRTDVIYAEDSFMIPCYKAMQQTFSRNNYNFVLRYAALDDYSIALEEIENSNFAGLLVSVITDHDIEYQVLSRLSRLKVPMVVFNSNPTYPNISNVMIHSLQGAHLATEYLIGKYDTIPGHLHADPTITDDNFILRRQGFIDALAAHGFSYEDATVHHMLPTEYAAYTTMKGIIDSGASLARCYFADNDYIALGTLHALRDAGIRVPEEVAVIGFDDLIYAEHSNPPLTTIHVPWEYLGSMSAQMLLTELQQNNQGSSTLYVNTILVERQSS